MAPTNRENLTKINLYYKGLMHKYPLEDEHTMKNIIKDNVSAAREGTEVNLIIHYQSAKTRNLIMKNNPAPPVQDDLKRMNVVYQYTCPVHGCPGSYIGMTTMHLFKRLSCHVQQGTIKMHRRQIHNLDIFREYIINNVEIIGSALDGRRLRILEALHIQKEKPSMNTTQEVFLLPTCQRPAATRILENTRYDEQENDSRSAQMQLPVQGLGKGISLTVTKLKMTQGTRYATNYLEMSRPRLTL